MSGISTGDKSQQANHAGSYAVDRCDPVGLTFRIDAVAEAQKRSRAAFLASTIVSVVIIIAIWNAYWSWYRGIVLAMGTKFSESQVTSEAQRSLLNEWVRSRMISIPILGIEAGVGDGAVIGSLSLYIICIWVLLSMRRENHIIGLLLRDTTKCNPTTRDTVFHGIISFSVFTIVSNFDEPIDDLDRAPREKAVGLVRLTYKILIMLPAITIIWLLLNDVISLFFLPAPFRENNAPVWTSLHFGDWVRRVLMEFICVIVFIPTLGMCLKIIKYNNGTENILRQYERKLREDLKLFD